MFQRIIGWFTAQKDTQDFNIDELLKKVKSYEKSIESYKKSINGNKEKISTLEGTVSKLTEEKHELELRNKAEVDMLTQQVLEEGDRHVQKQQKIKNAFYKLIDEHCKKYNIRSPFDNTPPKAPIIQSEFFSFSKAKQTRFLERLAKLKIVPNEEQEAMLFSENPATCVRAGAGSGKSTILAARVSLFRLVEGIPLSKITVTTFTRASRQDFIDKLINNLDKLSLGRVKIDQKAARNVVRTFHSIAYGMNKRFGDGRKVIIGDWTPVFETEGGEELDIEDFNVLTEKEKKKKYNRDKSIRAMSDIMITTYKDIYTNNPEFKYLIDILFNFSIKQAHFNPKKIPKKVSYNASRLVEDSISALLLNDWLESSHNRYASLLERYPPTDEYFEDDGDTHVFLHHHLYLPKQNVRVFLSPCLSSYQGKNDIPEYLGTRYSLSSWLLFRKLWVYFKASNNFIWVDSAASLQRLLEREDTYGVTIPPPLFAHSCVGEFFKTPEDKGFTPIYDQFKGLAEFIYSLGESICNLNLGEQTHKRHFNDVPRADMYFLRAAIIFNQALEECLVEENLITFEQIFHQFKDEEHKGLNSAAVDDLSWCEHLLIDEFQDISPNIIKFLNNIKRVYTKKAEVGSIMFVGDGSQSIYVWRGSSYQYIQTPDEYFPIPGKFSKLPLRSNYRSAKPVIDLAELPLRKIGAEGSIIPARGDLDEMESRLLITKPINKNGKDQIDYDALADHLEEEVNRVDATEDKPVYVLYRAHSQAKESGSKKWDTLFNDLLESGRIRDFTIHTSKGLEARSVFIIGDIAPGDWNPLKDALYSWCDVGVTYEEAQYHEACCMCYVAITRAENNVYWYLNNVSDKGLGIEYLSAWPSIVR